MALTGPHLPIRKIVSGGQTGADRAALDWALDHGVEHGGWCPNGRRAEDGVIPPRYRLRETASADYRERTRQNVVDSDGTLLVNLGSLQGGTLYTRTCADETGRPLFLVQADSDREACRTRFLHWLASEKISVLNVAGPRASKQPEIYRVTYCLLDELFY